MKKVLDAVTEFHKAFNHPLASKPCIPDIKVCELRAALMEEENNEYLEACINNDLVEVADALGDKLYILAGTMLAHGMQDKIMEIFNEIHRSNMSKLGTDNKPVKRADGKVLKGPDYFSPDILSILEKK